MSSCCVSWVLFGFASLGKTVGCFTFSCFVKYIVAICMLFCYICHILFTPWCHGLAMFCYCGSSLTSLRFECWVKISADIILKYFFLIFPRIGSDTSCNLHEVSDPIF